jgi:hypothetical protein
MGKYPLKLDKGESYEVSYETEIKTGFEYTSSINGVFQ